MAIVQVIAGVIVWLELAVRNAAIYLAVLFFPVALAASIWPSLAGWTSRLARLLFLFVILKPVTLIVLAFAGQRGARGPVAQRQRWRRRRGRSSPRSRSSRWRRWRRGR